MKNPKGYAVAIGSACMDKYYTLPHWIAEGNKSAVRETGETVGGMMANAACVMASYGIYSYLLDTVNDSPVSKKILRYLEGRGVNISTIRVDPKLPDAQCFIFLTEHERTVFAVDGNKPEICVDDGLFDLLCNAALLYSTTYNFLKLSNVLAYMNIFHSSGVKLALDIESINPHKAELDLIQNADILFFNQYGFEQYCAGRQPEQCLEDLLAGNAEAIAITLGNSGCYCRSRTSGVTLPGLPVNPVDTTGAGDTFNASFLYYWMRGESLEKCAWFANAAAARSVTIPGPHGGAGSEQQVLQWAQQFKIEGGMI